MKKPNSKCIIILLFSIIYLLIQKFIIIPNFNNYCKIINLFFCIILSIICYQIFGYAKNRSRTKKDVIQIFITGIISFFTLYYASSLVFGFRYNPNNNMIINIIEVSLLIISNEYIRECFIKKNKDNSSLVLISILFTFIELFYLFNIKGITNNVLLVKILVTTSLPILNKNILLTYTTSKVGLIPSIIYRLIMDLYVYIFPYFPNVNFYLEFIIKTIFPLILLYFINNLEDKKFQKKSIIYPIIIFIILMFLTLILGVFRYQLMAVVSNSMVPKFSRGDAVIFKRITPNDYDKLNVGDILIYKKNNIQIIHRIVEKDSYHQYVYTKGDNNSERDKDPVTESQYVGIYKMKIPFIGYPSVFIYELLGNKEG